MVHLPPGHLQPLVLLLDPSVDDIHPHSLEFIQWEHCLPPLLLRGLPHGETVHDTLILLLPPVLSFELGHLVHLGHQQRILLLQCLDLPLLSGHLVVLLLQLALQSLYGAGVLSIEDLLLLDLHDV